MKHRIRIGTASWTDPTLTKETDWYPKRSMSAEERLRFYAARWLARTPDEFLFDIKAFGLFTGHGVKREAVWPDVAEALPDGGKPNVYLDHLPVEAVDLAWEHFRQALMPLHSAGKLGAVFFQFPPWFRPSRRSRAILHELAERLPDYDLAVEFRHASWLAEPDRARTLDLLERHRLAHTCVDEPQGFPTSVPPVLAVTAPLAVPRLHGHNEENWERKGITPAERFRYLYSPQELEAWAPRIEDLATNARETHVLFNNCYRDYGVRNAAQLAALLDVA